MTPKIWAKGLLAAIISAVSNAIITTISANAIGSPLNWAQIGAVAATSALLGAAMYLKQSPVPTEMLIKTNTTTVTNSQSVTKGS